MLVGKGVCFDAGGVSIKPAQGMHEMKYDMCGAAAVLRAMMTLAHLGPRVNLVAVVPAVETHCVSAAASPCPAPRPPRSQADAPRLPAPTTLTLPTVNLDRSRHRRSARPAYPAR